MKLINKRKENLKKINKNGSRSKGDDRKTEKILREMEDETRRVASFLSK